MNDPLSEIVSLLQPMASVSKVVSGAGSWCVSRTEFGQPFYCAILEGSCELAAEGHSPIAMEAGDFILIPAANNFTMSNTTVADTHSVSTRASVSSPLALPNGEIRHGLADHPADVRLLVGHCTFGSPDASLLVQLLPALIHTRGEKRLSALVQLVNEEASADRPARGVILKHLIEVLFIEALRFSAGSTAPSGLLRTLTDERLATAIRLIHANPSHAWTVAQLAKEAALSRAAFFDRFHRTMGIAPMAYLLSWRMALAKKLLLQTNNGMAEIAKSVGYSSASGFSVAFTRYVGQSPGSYRRNGVSNPQG